MPSAITDVILVEEESPLKRIWTTRSCRSRRAQENLTVLIATAAAFLLFVIAEMVGSYLSNSLALLSDAGAMVVDVLTYLCNIYAEILKAHDKEMDRTTRFTLEVLMPGISLVGLLAVTTYVTYQAIHILQCPEVGHDNDVDINYLYGFSAANVLIDVFSSMMFFFKPNDSVEDLSVLIGGGVVDYNSINRTSDQDDNTAAASQNHILDGMQGLPSTPTRSSFTTRISRFNAPLSSHAVEITSETVVPGRPIINLNMMSAFTHMIGDCLRTTSVIIAALVSSFLGVPGRICDAVASIIATCTILIIAVPLGFELFRAFRHFYDYDGDIPVSKEVSQQMGYCHGHNHFHVSMPTPPMGPSYNNKNTEVKTPSLLIDV